METQELLTGVHSNPGPVPTTAAPSVRMETVLQAHGISSCLFQVTSVCPCSSLSRTSRESLGLAWVHRLPHGDFALRSLAVGRECAGEHSWLVSSSVSLRDEPLVRHFRASSL